MPHQPTIEETSRATVEAAMTRRGLSCQDVARMTGLTLRTIQRFTRGETFSLATLARIEWALRLRTGAGEDSDVGKRGKTLGRPVVGWKEAAQVLRLDVWTLWAARRNHGDTRRAWWSDEAEVKLWYRRMIGEVG